MIFTFHHLRTAELEGNLEQFGSSDLCMAYRYRLQQMMSKRWEQPFLVHKVDVNNDFEGTLRYFYKQYLDSCNFISFQVFQKSYVN